MPLTRQDDRLVESILTAYQSACRSGKARDAFQVAARTLMELQPDLHVDEAMRTVAEIVSDYDGPPPSSYSLARTS